MNKKVLHTVFERTVSERPNAIAIESDSRSITYTELNRNANQIAGVLDQLGVSREDVVCSFFNDRSLQISALLGTFKAGKIYLPLDEKYKMNHWSVLYDTIRPQMVLTTREYLERIKASNMDFEFAIPKVVLLSLNSKEELQFEVMNWQNGNFITEGNIVINNGENLDIPVDGNDNNYIFFTSGSTGRPKAVFGNHKSLSHFIHWESKELEITASDRIGQLTSLSFDASLRDIFLPFIEGARICIPSTEVKNDIGKLKNWIKEKDITILHTIPTMMRMLSANDGSQHSGNYFPSLRYMLLAGEKLYKKDISDWRALYGTNTTIINLYGTTEATLVKTFYRVPETMTGDASAVLCVGKPISNTNILILNANNDICDIGEVGDVYIQTPFLTSGYYKDPEMTSQKFVTNPIGNRGDIIYKTGDFGKYDNERNLVVLGRKDGVVKLNGVRCDINSIEENILELEDVNMVKCLPHTVNGSVQSIICFYTASEDSNEAIRTHCLKFLSDYELLSLHFIHLEEFPVNSNGKIDTIDLNERIKTYFQHSANIELPVNETEKDLLDIWKKVLNMDKISVTDNIFMLGGNSIHLIQLATHIHSTFGVELDIFDLFNLPVLRDQANKIAKTDQSSFKEIPLAPEQDSYPLSSSQYRIWVVCQSNDSSAAYNTAQSIEINEALDVPMLNQAVNDVIERHEILRTVFRLNDQGEPRQHILSTEEVNFELDLFDYRGVDQAMEKIEDRIDINSKEAFNLEEGPLLKLSLFQLSEAHFVLSYNIHHILCDGWSMGIFSRDLLSFYNAYKESGRAALPELRIQFKDYACWDDQRLKEDAFDTDFDYWNEKLSGELPLLNLPTEKKRPSVKTHEGRHLKTYLPKELTRAFKQFCNEQETSLYIGLYASFNLLLHKYTGDKDFILGTPVAGRSHIDLENQIGVYVNSIALRSQIDPKETIAAFFERTKGNILKDYKHQDYPFDHLVNKLKIGSDISRSPVFDATFRLHNVGITKSVDEIPQEVVDRVTDHGIAKTKFDLDFSLEEIGEYLDFNVVFNSDVYEKEIIAGLMSHFKQLIASLISQPEATIEALEFLNFAEKEELLVTFNNTRVAYPKERTLVDLFEEQTKKTPNQIALVFEKNTLTYEELSTVSTQLASYLIQEHKVATGDFVGITLDRNEWHIITLLAILKAGGTFVPIDSSYPQDRIEFMTQDSNCAVTVDQEIINDFRNNKTNYTNILPEITTTCDSAAYVMYTSGSTGRPKGVVISHKNIVRLVKAANFYQCDEKNVLLCTGALSFDATTFEFFGPLLNGGQLVMTPKNTLLDVSTLKETIREASVNVMWFTAGWLNQIVDTDIDVFQTLSTVLVGGDKLSPTHIGKLRTTYPDLTIINGYGPTENTTFSLTYSIGEVDGDIPIGFPISNSTVYILDPNKKLVPKGVMGELYLGGDGLAKEYLNQPELTSEKFVSNPFIEGELLYKTGDLGKWMPNGSVVFGGRADNQVKINGHRIELGEIENCLQKKTGINEAVVKISNKEMVAYYVANEATDSEAIRNYLFKELPAYMVPSYYIQLDAMPLNTNGKVDRASLPDVTQEDKIVSNYLEPSTEEEIALVTLCQRILGVGQVGLNDNFYHLGGDSIKLISLISGLKKQGYVLRAKDALHTLNFQEMASKIGNNLVAVDQSEVVGEIDLSPIQEYFFTQLQVTKYHHFNMSVVLKSNQRIDKEILLQCAQKLTEHHDALRMSYTLDENGTWNQYNMGYELTKVSVPTFDLRTSPAPLKEMAAIGENVQSGLELEAGNIFKIVHFQLETSDRIALVCHHLVVDGISWRILVEDLEQLYNQYANNQKATLPQKSNSFKDWVSASKEYAAQLAKGPEKNYWDTVVGQNIDQLTKNDNGSGYVIDKEVGFHLETAYTQALSTKVNQVYDTKINHLLMTALGQSIRTVFGSDKTMLRMEGHGREDIFDEIDISRTVGWFTSIFPFVLDVSQTENSIENLIQVKQDLERIPNKGIGYGILKYHGEGFASEAIPDVTFNYLGEFSDASGSDDSTESTFSYASDFVGNEVGDDIPSDVCLKVSGKIFADQLRMTVQYPSSDFDRETMETFIVTYKRTLEALIDDLLEVTNNAADTASNEAQVSKYNIGTTYDVSYNQNYYLKLKETIGVNDFYIAEYDERNFEKQFRNFMAHYPILCVSLGKENGKIKQTYISNEDVKLKIVSQDLSENTREAIDENMKTFFMKPFELFEEEFIRVFVITDVANRKGALVNVGIHHGITDAYTNNILMTNAQRYFAGETIVNNALSSFEFAGMQEKFLNSPQGLSDRNFWKEQFSIEAMRNANTEKDRITDRFIKLSLTLQGSDFEQLQNVAKDFNVPLNGLIMALHQFMMVRFTPDSNFIQNIIVNGREQMSTQDKDILGAINNILPLSLASIQGTKLNVPFVKEVYSMYIDARMRQEIPFEIIQEDMDKAYGVDINAYVGGDFNYQKYNESLDRHHSEKVTVKKVRRKGVAGIHMQCAEYKNALEINLSCSRAIYAKSKNLLSLDSLISQNLLSKTEIN
ncbi:amino acid adenylation domain-containing protein [Aureisphaera galaxeae]|uniref:non-ribosomal peptide synthetase n=1 Tax=Aureisphaera galaxeae TaxID=1538023 RepID=UPI00234FC98C|nr:non-ribosomal peptide synthetase [Aureisphaera galaxeae]MDC8004718.1 amino acid adenylation domain-containing protein [Aureisphaera galaxeae]